QSKVLLDARRMQRETVIAIGAQIRTSREDLGISQARLAATAGVSASHLSRIEAATTEASVDVLSALAAALGGRLRVRIEPGSGSPIRDHIQACMVDELVRRLHARWRRFLEVPVYRPVRGVIDAVLGDRTVLVAPA